MVFFHAVIGELMGKDKLLFGRSQQAISVAHWLGPPASRRVEVSQTALNISAIFCFYVLITFALTFWYIQILTQSKRKPPFERASQTVQFSLHACASIYTTRAQQTY